MSEHPNYYTDLLHRRCAGDATLTPAQQQELDLHLLICLRCNFSYARQAGAELLAALTRKLDAGQVAPYLPDLAQALATGQQLDDFAAWLLHFTHRDPAAAAHLRLCLLDQYAQRGPGATPAP